MNIIEIDTTNYEQLMQQYNIGSLLAKVLCSFSYSNDERSSFFRPVKDVEIDEECFAKTKDLLDDIALKRRKVFIFGDYDCDGICATTILAMILDKLNIQRGYYIPNRIHEGYGLNIEKLQLAYEKGYRVLFTVDNGVSAQEGLKWAREHDMTVIVSDHHRISEDVPCDVLIHPSCMNEDKVYLCGTTVIYMLAKYLKLADDRMSVLAALATISDVMELKGINVTMVKQGLALLSNGCYPALTNLDSFDNVINEEDVSFKIVPKINAVGRMEDYSANTPLKAYDVVRYLLGEKDLRAQLNYTNDLRRQLTTSIMNGLQPQIDSNRRIMVLYDKNAPVGLIGAIASRISSQYDRVVFVLCENEGIVKGSGRSTDDVDIMELLAEFKEKTLALGGHRGACGLSLSKDDFPAFKDYIAMKENSLGQPQPTKCIKLSKTDLTVDNMRELFAHRPFGQGRKLPMVYLDLDRYDSYGTLRTDHQLKWSYNGIEMISFENEGYGHYLNQPLKGIGELSENRFRGKITYTIKMKELA